MITKRSIDRVKLTITTAATTGSVTFQKLGHLRNICILAPSAIATYDYEITGSDGEGLTGKTGQTGNVTVAGDIPVSTLCTLTLANATTGTYTIIIYIDTAA